MENILSQNVRRICKEQKIQLKELAAKMGVDPAALTRALGGNARLDTMQKMATALGVSMKSLFEPMNDMEVLFVLGNKFISSTVEGSWKRFWQQVQVIPCNV